jgi:hypothetical protein
VSKIECHKPDDIMTLWPVVILNTSKKPHISCSVTSRIEFDREDNQHTIDQNNKTNKSQSRSDNW